MAVEVGLLSHNNLTMVIKDTLSVGEDKSAKGALKKVQQSKTVGKDKNALKKVPQERAKTTNKVEVPDYRTVLPKMQVHAQNIANIRAQTELKSKLLQQYGDYVDIKSAVAALEVKVDTDFSVHVRCNEKKIKFKTLAMAEDTISFNENADDTFIPYKEIYDDDSLNEWMLKDYQNIEMEDIKETNNIEAMVAKKRGKIFSPYNKMMSQGGFKDEKSVVVGAIRGMGKDLEKEIVQKIGEKLQKDYGLTLAQMKNTKYKL